MNSSFRKLCLSALVTLSVLVPIAWLTGLRAVVHRALLAIAVRGWPAQIAATVLVFGGLISLAAIGRRRAPVACGVAIGVTKAVLVAGFLVALIIVPGELRTVQALAAAKVRLELIERRAGTFPFPDAAEALRLDESGPLTDGFGQPLSYELTTRWKYGAWRLTSRGYDRRPSTDDLCLQGATRVAVRLDDLRAQNEDEIASPMAPLRRRIEAIRQMACPRGPR